MAIGNLAIEKYSAPIKYNKGLLTKLPVSLSGTAATLSVGGTSTFTGVATFTASPVFSGGRTVNVVSGSGATATLTTAQSGSYVLMDRAAGIVFTLPAPVAGLNFTFLTTTTVTSNTYKVITDAGTTFATGSLLASSDNLASKSFLGNGTSHIATIMNSASSNATGGIIGSVQEWRCVSATLWVVTGIIVASSTPTTPWSTS